MPEYIVAVTLNYPDGTCEDMLMGSPEICSPEQLGVAIATVVTDERKASSFTFIVVPTKQEKENAKHN